MTKRDYKEQGIYIFFQVHLKKKEESEVTEDSGQKVKSEEKKEVLVEKKVSEVKNDSEEKKDSEENEDPTEESKVLDEQNDSIEHKGPEENEDSKEQNKPITIAKFYSFSEDNINKKYTMINMGDQKNIDGSIYTISIKSGIQENNKTILGAAYNGNNTFEIVENTTISDFQHKIQKEKSLLNFYHYGIYDWIIFQKIKQFIDDNEKEDLDPNQINLELTNSDRNLHELNENVGILENTVKYLESDNGL
jgi:hypothetical protein